MAITRQTSMAPLEHHHLDQLKEWGKVFSKYRSGFDALFDAVDQVVNRAMAGVDNASAIGLFITNQGLMYTRFRSDEVGEFYADPKLFRPTKALQRVNFNKVSVTNRLAIRFTYFTDLRNSEHLIGSIVLPNAQSIPVWHWQFRGDHIDHREMRAQLHKGLTAATTLDLDKLRDEVISNTVALNRFLGHDDVSANSLGKVLEEELCVKSRLQAAQMDNYSSGAFALSDIYGCRMSADFHIEAVAWGTSVTLRMCGLELPIFKVETSAMESFGEKHGTDFEVRRFVDAAIPTAQHLLDLI